MEIPAAMFVEPLEVRALLTGNVVASMSGPHLSVSGDVADNQLEVTIVNNQVVLRGLSGTTVNGSTALFVIADNSDTTPGNIRIETGAGNDTVILSRNVKIHGSTWLDGGTGNDSISVDGATFQNTVNIFGRAGNDTISVQNATTEGMLRLKGKSGDDLISLTNVTANGEIRIEGNQGADGVSLNNVTTQARTKINTGSGNDDIVIRNSTLHGALRVRTRQDFDVMLMDGNTVDGPVAINMGRNSDTVQLRNTNIFNGAFHVQSGDGNADEVDIATTSVFNAGRRIRKSEGSTATASQTARIDTATTGLIARATAADAAAAALVTIDLTLDNSANTTTPSVGGALITRNASFQVAGSTLPGATVTLDTNNDGVFDNGTLTADSLGHFSTTVTLLRKDLNTSTAVNDQLNGFNKIKVRSTIAGLGSKDLEIDVDYVPSTDKIVKFTSSQGTYEVELFNSLTPLTVANFLNYQARYNNSIIHRVPGSPGVIQGGGFTISNGAISNVATDMPVTGEPNADRSNIVGTLAMALSVGPNSGTSQWYINTTDNSASLDSQNFTVFGRVIGNGMTVVNRIAAITRSDISTASGYPALATVPLTTSFTELTKNLTGTVSGTTGSVTVTGVGTKFLTELHGQLAGNPAGTGSRILFNGATLRVLSVQSDTSLTLVAAPTTTSTAQTAKTDDFSDANFVKFSSIAEILSV